MKIVYNYAAALNLWSGSMFAVTGESKEARQMGALGSACKSLSPNSACLTGQQSAFLSGFFTSKAAGLRGKAIALFQPNAVAFSFLPFLHFPELTGELNLNN